MMMPQLLPGVDPRMLVVLRDTESVAEFAARLRGGIRRVVLVGNGGIALELV